MSAGRNSTNRLHRKPQGYAPSAAFPAQSGLDEKPTIINNVKTLSTVPAIITRGCNGLLESEPKKARNSPICPDRQSQ